MDCRLLLTASKKFYRICYSNLNCKKAAVTIKVNHITGAKNLFHNSLSDTLGGVPKIIKVFERKSFVAREEAAKSILNDLYKLFETLSILLTLLYFGTAAYDLKTYKPVKNWEDLHMFVSRAYNRSGPEIFEMFSSELKELYRLNCWNNDFFEKYAIASNGFYNNDIEYLGDLVEMLEEFPEIIHNICKHLENAYGWLGIELSLSNISSTVKYTAQKHVQDINFSLSDIEIDERLQERMWPDDQENLEALEEARRGTYPFIFEKKKLE